MTKSSTAKLFRGAIMGLPGSGKGTISARIVQRFDIIHLSSGDILRQNIIEDTELGRKIKKYISDGKLVPDSIVDELMFLKIKHLSNRNLLLDGYPRTEEQVKKLLSTYPLDLVINLVVPLEVIIERMKNRLIHLPSGRVYSLDFNPPKEPGKDDVTGELLTQRPDDQPEAIKKRLEVYMEMTLPLIRYYKKQGIIKEFRGSSSNSIWPKVEEVMSRFMESKS